ncbi:unnamed protein product [Pleuronectes platessa]|uniref:Uncharacterized protein n=1 Tax=Pleuronectes platessa TaxID=8262 RepID=A0A9N7YVT0_PLEPL|nr:unnamed protein product [Pleuronectes platessa]
MGLAHRNLAPKIPMNTRERRLNEDKTQMQAGIVSLEMRLKNAKAMQRDESESLQFLDNLPKEQQVDRQKTREELMEYKIKVEDVTRTPCWMLHRFADPGSRLQPHRGL